jgi:hypothetical protein
MLKIAATLAAIGPTAVFAAEPGVVQASFHAACCAIAACCGLPCCP